MQALNQLAPEVGLAPACAALNLNRSSVYREDARRRLLVPATATLAPRPPAPLAFSTKIGVEKATNLPSLQTVRAVFPHTAFQSRISSSGLTSHSMSFFHSEKPMLGEIRIWHKLM